MITYKIVYKNLVKRDWRRIPKPIVAQIFQAIDGLRTNPYPLGAALLQPPLQSIYRLKVGGNYRLAYSVDEQNHEITIHKAGTRQNFYQELRQRLRV